MNTINVVLVALYRYLNFPVRIMHPLLKQIDGVNPYAIFFKDCHTNIFQLPSAIEEYLFIRQIIEINPQIVGFSVLSPFVPIARRLTKLVKENTSALVIWGGVHATISPEACITEADIVCIGEGEGAIADLVKSLMNHNEYNQIKNLWVKSNGTITKNSMRPLVQNLDSLPFPSYGSDSFFFIDFNKIIKRDPSLVDSLLMVQASRGCPFVCSFCANSILQPMYKGLGHYTRRRSVGNIIQEIKEIIRLSENRKDYIDFIDEVFGDDENWIDEFASAYKKEVGISFYVEYNPRLVNHKIISKLAEAGLDAIQIGIQSGSDHIRNRVFHRPGKNREIVAIANEIARCGVKIRYDLIIDNPYDTEESLKDTINVLLLLPKPLIFNLYSLHYFPDYPCTRRAIKDGYLKEEELTVQNLMERVGTNWVFIPKLFPYSKKQVFQNIIWLVVWNLTNDKIVKYAVFGESFISKLSLFYLNFKAIIYGKIIGVGGVRDRYKLVSYILSVMKYLSKGDIKELYHKMKKVMLKRELDKKLRG